MSGHEVGPDEIDLRQAELPPVTNLAIVTLALLVSGGVYLAAQLNRSTSLVVPGILVGAAVLCLLANVVMLTRLKEFAWGSFFLVGKWALLGYVVIAGVLEFVFVYDHTPARELSLFTVMLVVFAVNVPLLLAYSVARYQPVSPRN